MCLLLHSSTTVSQSEDLEDCERTPTDDGVGASAINNLTIVSQAGHSSTYLSSVKMNADSPPGAAAVVSVH